LDFEDFTQQRLIRNRKFITSEGFSLQCSGNKLQIYTAMLFTAHKTMLNPFLITLLPYSLLHRTVKVLKFLSSFHSLIEKNFTSEMAVCAVCSIVSPSQVENIGKIENCELKCETFPIIKNNMRPNGNEI
jgi:hypothetical protein